MEGRTQNKTGVDAVTVTDVTTANEPKIQQDGEKLEEIIVTNHHILMQSPQFSYEPANFIYYSSETITSIGIHIGKKLLFIIDETRAIYK